MLLWMPRQPSTTPSLCPGYGVGDEDDMELGGEGGGYGVVVLAGVMMLQATGEDIVRTC